MHHVFPNFKSVVASHFIRICPLICGPIQAGLASFYAKP